MTRTRDALQSAAERLARAGVEAARLEARLLLAAVLNVDANTLVGGARALAPDESEAFETLLRRRLNREPVAYITGMKEFWSLPFDIGPGALIPRPETELMIESAVETFPDRNAPLKALDLGTGSGCILIAFLATFPNTSGLGIDVSTDAVSWAQRNAVRNGVEARGRFQTGDWANGIDEIFDIIFANPPYIDAADMGRLAPDVGLHEPHVALTGGADGLDAYRILAPQIANLLAPRGAAFVEIGLGQAEAVSALMNAQGLATRKTSSDLAGIPRNLMLAHAGS